MMKVLMKNQQRILVNTVRSQPLKNYAVYLLSFLVIGIFLFFLSKGIWTMADSFTSSMLEGLLSYGQLAMIGLIILLGLPQVFKDLYTSNDLELLFTLPIPTRNIFW